MRYFLTLPLILGVLGTLGGRVGKSPVPLEDLSADYSLEQTKNSVAVHRKRRYFQRSGGPGSLCPSRARLEGHIDFHLVYKDLIYDD